MNKTEWNETDLLIEFKKGNAQAMRQVYNLYYPTLCYFAGKIVDNRQESEDIVVECFVKLWSMHANFNTLQNIKAFLFIATRNACLNAMKLAKRQVNSKKEFGYLFNGAEEYVLHTIIKTEVLQRIYEEIEKLPKKSRTIFKLLYLDGLKAQEVANKLQVSIHTVRAQRKRAVRLLRIILFKKGILSYLAAMLPLLKALLHHTFLL